MHKVFFIVIMVSLTAVAQPSFLGPSTRVYGFSYLGTPRYSRDFDHFDDANPSAPKGGTLRLASQTAFTNLNPYLIKGNALREIHYTFQSLCFHPASDSFAQYPLVARNFDIANDKTWMIVNLRPEARWHDGSAINADDVVFSFQSLMRPEADPYYRTTYADVIDVEKLDDLRILFRFRSGGNRELPQEIGNLPVISKKYYEQEDFGRVSMKAALGSGPYRLVSVEMGRFARFERVKDYWAANLPVQKGLFNFDRISVDIYRDNQVLFEAFKAHLFDVIFEGKAARWETGYNFPAVHSGKVIRKVFNTEFAQYPSAIIFNLRRPLFKDIRVRKALAELFNFEWMNRIFFFSAYNRARSFFHGSSDLVPTLPPSSEELLLLSPLVGTIPNEVFTSVFSPPTHPTDPSVSLRPHHKKAFDLLVEAGLKFHRPAGSKPGYFVDSFTGAPLTIEFLAYDPGFERIFLTYSKELAHVGVRGVVTTLDSSHYQHRLNAFQYDAIWGQLWGSEVPGNELRQILGSAFANVEGSGNSAGISDPAVDVLVDKIVMASNRSHVITAAKALDRVLMWNHYFLPVLSSGETRLAYWNHLDFVSPKNQRIISPAVNWWSTNRDH